MVLYHCVLRMRQGVQEGEGGSVRVTFNSRPPQRSIYGHLGEMNGGDAFANTYQSLWGTLLALHFGKFFAKNPQEIRT